MSGTSEVFESLSFDTDGAKDEFNPSAAAVKQNTNGWLANAQAGEKVWVKGEDDAWSLLEFLRIEGTTVVLKANDGKEQTVDVMAEIYQG